VWILNVEIVKCQELINSTHQPDRDLGYTLFEMWRKKYSTSPSILTKGKLYDVCWFTMEKKRSQPKLNYERCKFLEILNRKGEQRLIFEGNIDLTRGLSIIRDIYEYGLS